MTNKIIYAFTNPTLVPSSLKDGEEVLMARRLRQFFLNEARRPRPSAAEPAGDALIDRSASLSGERPTLG
jgi:hypothetical protein